MPNGELDYSFHPGRGCEGALDVFGPEVFCMQVQPDGKLVIAGSFTSFDDLPRKCIARVHAGITAPAPPAFLSAPPPPPIRQGQNTTLSVLVVSSGRPHLQWQHDGIDMAGATNQALEISNATVADAGKYALRASTDLGTNTSAPLVLDVI